MFSTSGYFRGVNCPYFASGLCERPYCHLRHVHQDDKEHTFGQHHAEEESNSKTDEASSLLSMVGDAIKQVQKDIELDQAKLKSVSDQNTTKRNMLLEQSTSSLTENYSCKEKEKYVKYPRPKLFPPKLKKETPKENTIEYNPTPIKELEKQKKMLNYDEYDPATNYSVFGSNSPGKRKNENVNVTVKAKRSRNESTAQVEAMFSDMEDEDIEAPEFSDLDNSGDENVFGGDEKKSKNSVSECTDSVIEKVHRKEDVKIKKETDKFGVFEKAGRKCNESLKIVPVEDILGIKLGEPALKQKSVSAEHSKGKSKHSSKKITKSIENNTQEKSKIVNGKENVSKKGNQKNIFEEFLNSEKLKAVTKKVAESGENKSSSKKTDNTSAESCAKTSNKHRHSSLIHHSSSHKERRHSSSEKDKKRRRSSSHNPEKHRSTEKSVTSDKEHRHKHSSHKHSRHTKESASRVGRNEKKSADTDEVGSCPKTDKDLLNGKDGAVSGNGHISSSHKHSHKHHRHKEKCHWSSKHSGHSHNKHRSGKDEGKKPGNSSGAGLKRQVSHVELFGEDSDSEGRAKVEENVVLDGHNSDVVEILSDTSDDDAPFISDEDTDVQKNFGNENRKSKHSEKGMEVVNHDIVEKTDSVNFVSVGKKRIAHTQSSGSSSKKVSVTPSAHRKLSPSEVMHNRFMELQKRAAEAAQAVQEAAQDLKKVKSPMRSSSLGGDKKRNANVSIPKPFMGSETLARKPAISAKSTPKEPESVTIATHKKGTTRVAHVPRISVLKRPTIPTEFGSKVPSNIRQRYLNQFIDECLRIYPDEKDAFDRALSEEKSVYDRSSSRVVYLNVAVNTIKRLRCEAPREPGPETETDMEVESPKVTSPTKQKTLSHMAVLGGAKAAKVSYTLHRSKGGTAKIPDTFFGADLYKRMNWYVMSEDVLVSNGFPRPDTEHTGCAVISTEVSNKKNSNPNEKICARCGKLFQVTTKGQYITKEACMYHWGKCWKKKVAGQVDNRWTCCQEHSGAKGCTLAPLHVFDHNKYDNLGGYVGTFPCSPPADGDYKVYALDCEMIYTTAGCELARITVVGPDLQSVYETLVQPSHHIVDYNTRFSGLTEDDFKGVTTTLEDVQEKLLYMFSDKTILIGHSLESDLIALKLIHGTVVDTSVVFPHRLGPPYKRALQTLMAEILFRIIQNDVAGHDSKEDAAACMELMIWKLKGDAKRAARR